MAGAVVQAGAVPAALRERPQERLQQHPLAHPQEDHRRRRAPDAAAVQIRTTQRLLLDRPTGR